MMCISGLTDRRSKKDETFSSSATFAHKPMFPTDVMNMYGRDFVSRPLFCISSIPIRELRISRRDTTSLSAGLKDIMSWLSLGIESL